MNGTFNGQILVDKLAKLNNSQQSIETLSHWCIFHRKRAKQVVEIWERQFHCAPKDQRVSFLHLANDILQNSRRKGSEFVGEFWKVLPEAISDVIRNGDEFGRTAALRLIGIWEERKVFGSRGQALKEELLGRSLENKSVNGKNVGIKLKPSTGAALENIISSYESVYDGPVNEDDVSVKCRTAITCVEKVDKEVGGNSGNLKVSGFEEELQGQHELLRECIEQMKAVESSRATLISHLRGALQEQEFKLDQLRNQLQAVDRASKICQQLLNSNSGQLISNQRLTEATTLFSGMPPNFISETTSGLSGEKREQSAPPVMYTQKPPSSTDNSVPSEEDHRKTTAAAMAAKLAASTSSAQMLSYVLSSLASEGVIGNSLTESTSSIEFPSDKRPKLENGPPTSYLPTQLNSPLPPHQPSLHPSSSPMSLPSSTMQPPPPPPTMPPVQPPPPPGQFMQTAGSMTSVPYSYGAAPQRPPPLPSYAMMSGAPVMGMSPYPAAPNPYQNVQASDSGFFNQQQVSTAPPMSRQ